MNQSSPRIRGLQIPTAFWLLLFVMVAPAGYLLYLAVVDYNSDMLIVFGCITAMLLICLAFICCYRIRIDENGVLAMEGRRKKRIPWSEVRSVHVIRLINGWRMIYISKSTQPPISPPYAPQMQTEAKRYLQETIPLGYTRKRIDCIRQHWQGDISV